MKYRIRHLAGHHINFIAIGNRKNHIGIVSTCPRQHIGMGCLADDGSDIQSILQLPQALFIGINEGDIVCFTGEIFSNRGPYLASAENDYFHYCLLESAISSYSTQE
jgi:hypothetical protein